MLTDHESYVGEQAVWHRVRIQGMLSSESERLALVTRREIERLTERAYIQ